MFKYTLTLNLLFNVLIAKESIYNFKNNTNKYIIGPWPGGGMGICLHSVLNHLIHCELNNKTPVVYWSTRSLYYKPAGFNGSMNVWEYYFEPTSNLSYSQGDKINTFQEKDLGNFNYYNISQEMRNKANRLFEKYIRVNGIIKQKIDQFYNNQMLGKRTIGIHLRGTDKGKEDKLVSPEAIITEAVKYADEQTQFLIASDEQKLLNRMINLLNGKKIIYYDCYRSQDGFPLHIHRGKPSYAQLGEDVIVEMYLLSKCNAFIHTRSSVSAIVLYLNPNLLNLLII